MPSMIEVEMPVAQHVGDPTKLVPAQSPRQASTLKLNHFGIEVVESIVWQGWEPGREYTKNIVLKNVHIKTQKVKYKNPSSRFFTTLYPKPVVLSAGTSFSLPVTFRPLEKILYEDKIEFQTKDGTFEVPIRAVLPEVDIVVPSFLDFSMCAAKDTVESTFQVSNTGDLETHVQWKCGDPFTIEPVSAILKSNTSKSFKATFKPGNACVYQGEAVCLYGPDLSLGKVTKLEGIGKYPHILVSSPGKPATTLTRENLEAAVQFGPTPVGSTTQKWAELHNLAPVRAPYKVEHPSNSRIDTVFDCPQKTGVVPPMGSVKIPFTYSPNTVDTTSIDYFNVVAIGNVSKSVIKCSGSSKGPTVQLSTKVVNFMQIDIGEVGTRTVDLVNSSDVEAVYQFMIDCNESVFKFEKISGVLRPNTKSTIILKFHPQHPINYHRQVTCMIHNQGPLFLDLLGTCHAEMVKPAVLLGKHLNNYKLHARRGLSVYPPEQLNDLAKSGKLELDDSGALTMAEDWPVKIVIPDAGESVDNTENVYKEIPAMDQYFNDGYHSDVVQFVPHISMDVNNIDFGKCQNIRLVEDKLLNITNHTHGKVTVQWIGGSDKTFYVTPLVMDIPPLKTCAFQVSFKPNAPNQFYGAELECYTYYKSLRDYRLVEDTTHCPPWCCTLTCAGHTFQPNNETFLPRLSLDSQRLIFPAVNTKESTYRTVLFTNNGTTPIFYDVEKDPSCVYAIKPAKALLKGEHQIFVVKITPPEVKTYKHALNFRLNDNEKYNKSIQLWGSAEAPLVLLDTEGNMFFKQTCIGTSSSKSYTIKNLSRIPLRYEWHLKHADRKLLTVTPDRGIIQPNETQCQTWSFVPDAEKKYVMKPSLIVWGQGFSNTSSGGKKKQFSVRAVGEGTLGDIKAEQSYLDFGDVVVGSSAAKTIVITNDSSCSLHYKLYIDQTLDGPYPEEVTRDDKIALILEKKEGILPARSKQTIMASVCPVRRSTYQFAISYQLITPEGTITHNAAKEPQHLCHVLTTGVFPFMCVTDARCYGSAIGISKKQLWSLFSLDNLNVSLDSDPSTEELRYSVATRHSHSRRPPVYTRAILDFNFSSAPLNSDPCIVNLMFENSGTVATEWAFLFPADLQLELEYWAETGEFDEDELHEMKVMDNKLFTIEPKTGKLAPGECKTVTLTYKHTMAGTDRLPVLLKLARGREILLNFVGVTVEPERRYIHFPSNKHMFTPIPVGEKNAPKQTYDMYNGGAVPVKFHIDLAPLDLLKKENYDQPIFECLNPVGEIQPGRTLAVDWRFSPIEAKTYMVDVPIHVHNGDTAIVTFTGVGYDRRVMGDTMPISDQQDLTGVPSIQSVPLPGQLAYLSQERLSFGNMPLFSRARQLVFVINKSRDRDVSFEWHVTAQADSQYLSISPVRGHLEPGESKMCRIVFVACKVPSFYDLDLVCEVTDEVEMREFNTKLQKWEKERERQKYEFTITENDLDADKRLPNSVEITERPSSRLQSLEDKKKVDSEGELTKYKTLPPIKQLSPDEQKAIKISKDQKEAELWAKPIAPNPFLLHLGLTARTHDIREFQINFPEEYKNFYVDRMLSEKLAGPIKQEQEEQKESETLPQINCTQAEAELVSGVLSNVLRGLLDDNYFQDSVKKVTNEAIPYYRQIGEPRACAAPDLTEGEPQSGRSSVASESRMSPMSSVDVTLEPKTMSIPATPTSVPAESTKQQRAPSSKSGKKLRMASKQHTNEEIEKISKEEGLLKQKQTFKKTPEFGNIAESIIENSLLNIMSEALMEEFNITARPRFIALPKRTASAQSKATK
ncbi:cilia- and flagella-associated protein 65-like isoform X1 [Argopecten irradians]|uniref:cilia- and flagella-associated protein 65-like isoform X1 n=1 Tax=Argopecten irradians TaxID=31199 RepID=UPI003720C87C